MQKFKTRQSLATKMLFRPGSYNIKDISGLTPLNCLTPKLCYEEIRATPLIFIDKSIFDRSLKIFIKENTQTNERGIGPPLILTKGA
jgi:hypothetical protein